MNESTELDRSLDWAHDTDVYAIHMIRINHLRRLFPEHDRDLADDTLPQDAFLEIGPDDYETLIWLAVTELADYGNGTIPSRREVANATGMSLQTVNDYMADGLSGWLVKKPGTYRSDTINGAIYHIPAHVISRSKVHQFPGVALMSDVLGAPWLDEFLDIFMPLIPERIILAGAVGDNNYDTLVELSQEFDAPLVTANTRLELAPALKNVAVITDDPLLAMLATGAGCAVYNSPMIRRELDERRSRNGEK